MGHSFIFEGGYVFDGALTVLVSLIVVSHHFPWNTMKTQPTCSVGCHLTSGFWKTPRSFWNEGVNLSQLNINVVELISLQVLFGVFWWIKCWIGLQFIVLSEHIVFQYNNYSSFMFFSKTNMLQKGCKSQGESRNSIRSLKLTWPPSKNIGAWETTFLLGLPMFRCYLRFREGIFPSKKKRFDQMSVASGESPKLLKAPSSEGRIKNPQKSQKHEGFSLTSLFWFQ